MQAQFQTALENLTQAVQRLEAAGRIIDEKQKETTELREKCERLQAALEKAESERDEARHSESELNELKNEKNELIAVRNRLLTEKNQLLGEREQFKKFREGWGRERPALIKAKTDAEQELQRLKEQNIVQSPDEEKIRSLNEEIERLRSGLEAAERKNGTLADEKENMSIELDGLRQVYEDLKQTTREASERLDATLEELKILRG